jgi:PAS domain S-box-containing protein
MAAENPVDRIIRNGSAAGPPPQTTLVAKDGTAHMIEDSASPICDLTGKIAGVVLVFRDVTERYRAEEIRRQTEERWRLMVESVTDYAFFSTDANGIITSWNMGAERMFGYQDEKILGRSSDVLFTPADVASNQPAEERATAGREGRAIDERWHRRADGSLFFGSGVMTPMRDESGALLGYTKVSRDITQRRQNEEEISRLLAVEQANAERLRQVATVSLNVNATLSIPSILDVVTEQARLIVGAHQAVSSLAVDEHGAQAVQSASLSTKYSEWTFYDAKPSAHGLYRKVCQTNRPMRLKIAELIGHSTWQASDEEPGHHPPMRGCLAAPFTWSNGLNKGLIQLSDKFQGEFSADDEAVLAQLALVASVAMENAHLYQEIRQADERKDEFLAVLAHELRNPLAPIRNALRILGEFGDDREPFAKLRKMMERQVEQMVRLVDDLLDLSRISRGRIELQLQQLELSDVVNNALETSRLIIEDAGHELSVLLPAEPIYLQGDMTRLSQILMNLLNNAAKYTDRGGKIWLTAHVEAEQVAIRVRDNGVGIPAEMLSRIFEMFAQVDDLSERAQGGLGIGLTLARTLVSLHRGSIEAFSAGLGKGSEFVVHLPRIAKNSEYSAAIEASNEVERVASPSFRILVVDDNRDAAESVAILLELSGNEVAVAHDGPSGIQRAISFRPDVALLDIGLPIINGYEVARQIRILLPEITSLIAITGWGQMEDVRRASEAGFDYHLVKPVDFEVLRKLLAEIYDLAEKK